MAKGKYQKWLEPEGLLKIEGWARDGLTEKEIADNMGIAYSTLREWKEKYPALSAPLKEGKDVPDRRAENALFKRVVGCKIAEETINYGPDDEVLSRKVVIKELPPEPGAIKMWLKNRMPEKWREADREINDTTEINKLDKILSEVRNNAIKQQAE